MTQIDTPAALTMERPGESGFEYIDGLPHDLAPALGALARIGLIVLASDSTVEHEWRQIMTPLDGVALYHNRIPFLPEVTAETLKGMEARLTESASLFMSDIPFDVIAYGCTSASVLIGPDAVQDRIKQARPEVKVTNPFSASLAALKQLNAKRIAVATPYRKDINLEMRARFEAAGLEVPILGSFNEFNDNDAARIAPHSIEEAAVAMGSRAGIDAVFVSCTSLRVADVAAKAEARLGKPVISSNLAMAWHALRLAGYDTPITGFGRLFSLAG